MKILQQIVDDIKQGENLDLYLTIATALVVAGLNLLSITPPNLLNSLMLAIFAIIASSLVGNRHRLDRIQKKLGETNKDVILKEYPDELENEIERANELWIIGVHAIAFLRSYRSSVEIKLKKGKSIRVLMVDPDGHASSMVAARNPGKLSIEREKANIIASLNDLMELKTIAPSKLQIRVIDDPLMYGGYMINPENRDGAIYIQRYSYQTGVRPKFIYYPESEWFGFVKSEFQSLWNRGKDWGNIKNDES